MIWSYNRMLHLCVVINPVCYCGYSFAIFVTIVLKLLLYSREIF